MARKTRKIVDSEIYAKAKKLINSERFSNEEIAGILDVSASAVSRIDRSISLEDMRKKSREANQRSVDKKVTREVSIGSYEEAVEEIIAKQTESTPVPSVPVQEDKTDTLTLQRIAEALERLADAWEQQPQPAKRGLFKGAK